MSPRWTSYMYVVPKPPKGDSKKAKRPFSVWNRTSLEESLLQSSSVCENCQRQRYKAFIGLTIRAKMIGGVTSSTWNFASNWRRWSEIADFLSISARSASAVTPREKSSLAPIGSPLHAFQWARDKHRNGTQKRSVQNLNDKLR